MRRFSLGLVSALGLWACSTDDSQPEGRQIALTVGAVSYPGATNVCYGFAIANGEGQLVVGRGPSHVEPARQNGSVYSTTHGGDLYFAHPVDYGQSGPVLAPICSTRYGNGPGGGITYVAPCDASTPEAAIHTVTLWLEDLYLGANDTQRAVAGTDYQDPCPTGCQVTATCQANADTLVGFDLTIMRNAQQGFFDVAVNFEDIFCSAKLDTCYGDDPESDAIMLLHGADNQRGPTAVLTLACTEGLSTTNRTFLHTGNVVVTCGEVETVLDLRDVAQAGNQPPVDGLHWATYHGSEALVGAAGPWNKEYFNVAVTGFGPDCAVAWRATASADQMAALADVAATSFTSYPVIHYGPTAVTAENGDWLCTRNPINGSGSQVVTAPVSCNTPAGCVGDPCTTWQAGVQYPCGTAPFDPEVCVCTTPEIIWNDLEPLSQAGNVYTSEAPLDFQIAGWPQGVSFWRNSSFNGIRRFTWPGSADGSFAGEGPFADLTFGWNGTFPYLDILGGGAFIDGTATFDFGAAATTADPNLRFVVGVVGTGGSSSEGVVTLTSSEELTPIGRYDLFGSGVWATFTPPNVLTGNKGGAIGDGMSYFILPATASSLTWTMVTNSSLGDNIDQFGFVVGIVRLAECPAVCFD